ncbi:putative FBD-associated F-box protein At5g56820 [Triticum urartu]|uniref:putative FBD-associated F-box protein At5g56820 n=1 Tax=Triticum urartu TaxID=4572 RepID=UPI0020434D3A|nr:putative FBD-associated F-box protein At5g56820 [Triticum urartu]XP_048533926.1 putative FBD-associated F-box protein At5g56820 [Triticum urartu]
MSSCGGWSFGAGHTFDGMSEKLNYEENIQTEAAGGEDRISALPDELLQYVMSFLLSRDAVRTCVLARRWRTLWKSMPALRIDDPDSYHAATGSSTFVDELLRLRDPTPLNVCDIRSGCQETANTNWAKEAFRHMEPWLLYALSCQVPVLRICFPWRVINMTLVSSHLKRLHLYRMRFEGCSLDFSSCQVLEVLEMKACHIHVNLLSQSLRFLKIHNTSFGFDPRTRISAPNLIGFRLAPFYGLAPLLDSMPSLVAASITLGEMCEEMCYCGNLSCGGCDAQAGNNDYPVALQGLSGATNLKLTTISYPIRLSVLRMDLTWRPMFRKLTKLLLNEWCVADDFTGLIYFLQHSPILETLILQLDLQTFEDYHLNEIDGSCNSREQSLLSQHLKVVKIICGTREDVIVHRISKILCAHGVPSEQIEIE